MEDPHNLVQPHYQPFIAALGLTELQGELPKDAENASGGVALSKLGREWVREKIYPCVSFVRFQGIIKDLLEAGGSRVGVRHGG
jgi:hypothetical protein